MGTREYLGIIDEQQDHIVTSIPVVSDKGEKDTIDAILPEFVRMRTVFM